MAVIEVNNLTKDYGHNRGIFDVSLQVKEGEVFGFLGPNGAGKTTTIRHLMGFSKPSNGKAFIEGKDCFKKAGVIHKKIGYLPGEVALPDNLTGWQFIRMMQGLKESYDNEQVKYLIEKFKVDPSGKIKRMSFGEKRKLALVAAFLSNPSILILDEPTSGLDPIMQKEFIEFLLEEKKNGKTILLSSHMFDEVDKLCNKVSIIKEGKIVSTINMNEIHHNQNRIFIIEFSKEEDALKFVRTSEFNTTVSNRRFVRVSIHEREINFLIRKIDQESVYSIASFVEERTTLQSYFLSFYQNSEGGAE